MYTSIVLIFESFVLVPLQCFPARQHRTLVFEAKLVLLIVVLSISGQHEVDAFILTDFYIFGTGSAGSQFDGYFVVGGVEELFKGFIHAFDVDDRVQIDGRSVVGGVGGVGGGVAVAGVVAVVGVKRTVFFLVVL